MLFVLALIWGSSFILMKRGLVAFPPGQVAGLRIVITAFVLSPFAISRIRDVNRKEVKNILLQGMFGNFIPAFLFPAAQVYISSSLAGILNSLSPVWVLVLGIFFFRSPYKLIRLIGIMVAFGGAIMLLLFQPSNGSTSNALFGLLIVLATLSYGLSANIIKTYLHDINPITITSVAFGIMFLPALIFLLSTDFISRMNENPAAWTSLGFIAVLATFGSAVASITFTKLVHRTNALFASSVTYLMPIVALFWGILDGEPIRSIDFLGMAMIFLGVYLVSR